MAAWMAVAGVLPAGGGAVEYNPPVAVIYGNESVAAGERAFAQSLVKHIVRWYKETAGMVCPLTDDTNLKAALANKKIAVLVYLAMPTAQQMQELKKFVEQ